MTDQVLHVTVSGRWCPVELVLHHGAPQPVEFPVVLKFVFLLCVTIIPERERGGRKFSHSKRHTIPSRPESRDRCGTGLSNVTQIGSVVLQLLWKLVLIGGFRWNDLSVFGVL